MALIIEDGSIVTDANSYITLDEARAYALDRGVELTEDDSILTPWLIKAADYLQSREDQFVGRKNEALQPLSWPRRCVQLNDWTLFPIDEIPAAIKNAQCQCVIEQNNGVELLPTTDPSQGGFVTRERVDVIETQYSETIGTTRNPLMPAVEALLAPFLRYGSGGLQTVRV